MLGQPVAGKAMHPLTRLELRATRTAVVTAVSSRTSHVLQQQQRSASTQGWIDMSTYCCENSAAGEPTGVGMLDLS